MVMVFIMIMGLRKGYSLVVTLMRAFPARAASSRRVFMSISRSMSGCPKGSFLLLVILPICLLRCYGASSHTEAALLER